MRVERFDDPALDPQDGEARALVLEGLERDVRGALGVRADSAAVRRHVDALRGEGAIFREEYLRRLAAESGGQVRRDRQDAPVDAAESARRWRKESEELWKSPLDAGRELP